MVTGRKCAVNLAATLILLMATRSPLTTWDVQNPMKMGYSPYQLLQDFFHQQYEEVGDETPGMFFLHKTLKIMGYTLPTSTGEFTGFLVAINSSLQAYRPRLGHATPIEPPFKRIRCMS